MRTLLNHFPSSTWRGDWHHMPVTVCVSSSLMWYTQLWPSNHFCSRLVMIVWISPPRFSTSLHASNQAWFITFPIWWGSSAWCLLGKHVSKMSKTAEIWLHMKGWKEVASSVIIACCSAIGGFRALPPLGISRSWLWAQLTVVTCQESVVPWTWLRFTCAPQSVLMVFPLRWSEGSIVARWVGTWW